MKKRTVLLLMVSGLFLASCASSGWSCCKRYGNIQKEKIHKTMTNRDQKPLV